MHKNPCAEIELPIWYIASPGAEDFYIDLDPEYHPDYAVAALFWNTFDGNIMWSMTRNCWVFSESSIVHAIQDSGFKRADGFITDTRSTRIVHAKSNLGKFQQVARIPVIFFKDRATFMRFKLYM